MYDAEAQTTGMWYTRKGCVHGGEPGYICYATASDPARPLGQNPSNPIISPMEDGGWASLGIGRQMSPSWTTVTTRCRSRVGSPTIRLGGEASPTSPDGVGWRLTRDGLRMRHSGETGGPEDAMISSP